MKVNAYSTNMLHELSQLIQDDIDSGIIKEIISMSISVNNSGVAGGFSGGYISAQYIALVIYKD